ncbi:MAG: ABC transporter ATP-binding protein [Nocardiopsaceae bacterium]|nr:ABC transporter ATP-binding protein [Nocardiopsaceae bacterium]
MANTAIYVRGLRKQYRGATAVAGIDLDVEHGEIFALLGPNGAGKTTTIEILEGNRRKDGGEVSVLGADPARAGRAWRARIGIVPQTQTESGELTVREMVSHFGAYFPDPRDADEVIESVGLSEQAGTRLRRLSGGQRRRVDVAVGIVGRPELLFLDEPTTGFDPQARRKFWHLIEGLAEDGTTILLTTHYLDEAAALARRVGVLAGGRVVAIGTPEDLGRSDAMATVSWQAADGIRSVRTKTPAGCVTAMAAKAGGELPGLTVTRPSLEDRYLELIGASQPSQPSQNGAEG